MMSCVVFIDVMSTVQSARDMIRVRVRVWGFKLEPGVPALG